MARAVNSFIPSFNRNDFHWIWISYHPDIWTRFFIRFWIFYMDDLLANFDNTKKLSPAVLENSSAYDSLVVEIRQE